MGLGHRWPEIAKTYAEVNALFGDIVKVTPSSKVVGDMALFLFTRGIKPADVVNLPAGATGTGLPDLTGLSAREALRELARLGLSARMQGTGVVVQQDPPAGAPLEPGATCTLVLTRRPPPRPNGAIGEQR